MEHSLKLPFELESSRRKFQETVRPFIKILPQEAAPARLHESKIGGFPYLPKGVDFPKNNEGKALFFLAQINFAETPRLNPFPEKGILQFYINDDGMFGYNLEHASLQENFRVLYFENAEEDKKRLQQETSLREYKDLPIAASQSFPLRFELSQEAVPLSDYRFLDFFGSDFFEKFGAQRWEIMDVYSKLVNAGGHKLGGYAFFTQQDPRHEIFQPLELLFQLDSDPKINCRWGDMGVANFFIRKRDLERRDFSRVLYNWDSY